MLKQTQNKTNTVVMTTCVNNAISCEKGESKSSSLRLSAIFLPDGPWQRIFIKHFTHTYIIISTLNVKSSGRCGVSTDPQYGKNYVLEF